MRIRTTVTLDEDVFLRVKHESQVRGEPFRDTLNNLLRAALLDAAQPQAGRVLTIRPARMGFRAGLNHDHIEALLEYGEGDGHR